MHPPSGIPSGLVWDGLHPNTGGAACLTAASRRVNGAPHVSRSILGLALAHPLTSSAVTIASLNMAQPCTLTRAESTHALPVLGLSAVTR